MKNIVFHGSKIGGLKTIEPKVCNHDKAYVYAINNKIFPLFFAHKKNEKLIRFIKGEMKNDKSDDITVVYHEAYNGSFKENFSGKKSYLYMLSAKNFKDLTRWKFELVSDKTEKVLMCQNIKDTYLHLQKHIKNKELIVKPYSKNFNKSYGIDLEQAMYFEKLNNNDKKKCKKETPLFYKHLEKNAEEVREEYNKNIIGDDITNISNLEAINLIRWYSYIIEEKLDKECLKK